MPSTAIRLTVQDLLAAWRLQRKHNLIMRLAWITPVFLGVLYLLTMWPLVREDGWPVLLENPALPAAAVFLAGLNILADRVLLPRQARRVLEQQKGLDGEVAFTWTEASLTITNPTGHSELTWGDYVRWLEDDAVFVLFQSENVLNPWPKRSLDAHQITEIRGNLERAIGKMGTKRESRPKAR